MSGSVLVLGATGGVGRAVAKTLYSTPAQVLLHGRDAARLERTRDEIDARLSTFRADLRSPSEVARLFESVYANHTLTGVVFSVAFSSPRRLTAKRPWDDFAEQLELQVKSLHLCVQQLVNRPAENRERVALVVLGSSYAAAPPAKSAPYSVAKAALTTYVQCLARELMSHQIRAHVVAPDLLACGLGAELPAVHLKSLAEKTLEGRLTEADDVAAVVRFLLRPEADALHGQVIRVERGRGRD